MATSRGIHDLVERQGMSFEARRRAADEQQVVPAPREPWITISRQLGSGGNELAHLLAARLGWHVYDHEIVARIARASHVGETIVRGHDERPVGVLQEQLSALMIPSEGGHAAYVDQLTHVIVDIARGGRAVILGRGANWFLDPARGLRLRVVAPERDRVQRVLARLADSGSTAAGGAVSGGAAAGGVAGEDDAARAAAGGAAAGGAAAGTAGGGDVARAAADRVKAGGAERPALRALEQDAQRRVREADAAQRAFVKQSFGRDIDDSSGYDLVLNTGTLGTEAAADLVVSVLRARFPVATAHP